LFEGDGIAPCFITLKSFTFRFRFDFLASESVSSFFLAIPNHFLAIRLVFMVNLEVVVLGVYTVPTLVLLLFGRFMLKFVPNFRLFVNQDFIVSELSWALIGAMFLLYFLLTKNLFFVALSLLSEVSIELVRL
jgi:hypothetical protein